MGQEQTPMKDIDMALIVDFFKRMSRQGPGGRDETLKALGFMGKLPEKAKIADLGCGSGAQTVTLAGNTDARITAIDTVPEIIELLEANMRRYGLDEWVTATVASMESLPFSEGELDVIWAEGSIYNMGFERGLREWRKYLKDGGFVAVTEFSWLTEERPLEIEVYCDENFPDTGSISEKIAVMQRCGYLPVAHFVLPHHCWIENYYMSMQENIEPFLEDHGNSEEAVELVGRLIEEIRIYRKYGDYFGYVFYIGRKI
jgi:ubiquinone/menaquinone biosynthesis C-methylase UbiE